jgi:hypothetical protein
MPAREFLLLIKESALNVPMTTPVAGVDSMYIRLSEGEFNMEVEPVIQTIGYGGGFAVTAESVTDHYGVKGSLKTKLYPTQALMLLDWLTTRIDAAQTSPWTTTENAGDLASVTVYHAILQANGVFRREKHTGVKCASGSIDISRDSTTGVLSLDLQGCRTFPNAYDASVAPDATEFPPPAEADYPYGAYTFTQTAGLLTIDSVRTQYKSINFKVNNKLNGEWFETSYLTKNEFTGRDVTMDVDLLLKAPPDDRASHETVAPLAASFGFDNGVAGQAITINMYARNVVSGLKRSLPMDKSYMQKLTLKSHWDPAANAGAGGDIAFSMA